MPLDPLQDSSDERRKINIYIKMYKQVTPAAKDSNRVPILSFIIYSTFGFQSYKETL